MKIGPWETRGVNWDKRSTFGVIALIFSTFNTPALRNIDTDNLDILLRFLLVHPCILDPMHHVEPLHRPPENRMLLVQPGRPLRRDEELTAVRVRSRIRHTDRVRLVMLERREFVGEFFAPDAFAARPITERIAALDHEFAYDAVEDCVVVIAVLAVGYEVLDGFGGGVGKEADVDVAVRGVQNGCGAALRGLGFDLLAGVEVLGLLILHVARRLADVCLVGEDVEADFS